MTPGIPRCGSSNLQNSRSLVLAEAEFSTDEAAKSFRPHPATIAQVTGDPRFTGGTLARTRRPDLLARVAEYGTNLRQAD